MAKKSRFPETRWSLLGRAKGEDLQERGAALTELLTAYRPGLRAYLIQGVRLAPEAADDVLQAFIADKLLSLKLVQHADARRGKFRSLLVKALHHYTLTAIGRERRRTEAEGVPGMDAALEVSAPTSVDVFDQEWVREIVRHALQSMKDDCLQRGRSDLWDVFQARVVAPILDDIEPTSYAEIVERFDLASPRQAINLLASAKRAFGKHLRIAVSCYAGEDENIDEEITELRRIVAR